MLADDQQDVGSASERQDGKRVVGGLLIVLTLRCGTLRCDITGYASVIIVFGFCCSY